MIKVARIIARLNVGGPARHVLLLGGGLRAHGYETVLMTGDLDDGEAELLGSDGMASGVRVERIPGLGRQIAPFHDLRALSELVLRLRRERPLIVHTHTAKAGALGRLAAAMAGVPIVVHTFHGHVLRHYFSPGFSAAVRWTERGLARLSNRIVTLSPGLRDELADELGIAPRARFAVIPLGRDLEPLRSAARGALRQELSLAPDAFLVGGVGRLVPIKRFPLLVDAFAQLVAAERAGTPPAHLVLVGDGIERQRVEQHVRQRDLGQRVHFLGWREDLARIYADLDVVALSSRNEGTPLAIVEAFAAGCPVVATAVGGIPDMFRPAPVEPPDLPPGVQLLAEGALVSPEGPQATHDLGAALALLRDRPALRAELGAAARAHSARWDGERLVSDMAQLYRELLATTRVGRRALAAADAAALGAPLPPPASDFQELPRALASGASRP